MAQTHFMWKWTTKYIAGWLSTGLHAAITLWNIAPLLLSFPLFRYFRMPTSLARITKIIFYYVPYISHKDYPSPQNPCMQIFAQLICFWINLNSTFFIRHLRMSSQLSPGADEECTLLTSATFKHFCRTYRFQKEHLRGLFSTVKYKNNCVNCLLADFQKSHHRSVPAFRTQRTWLSRILWLCWKMLDEQIWKGLVGMGQWLNCSLCDVLHESTRLSRYNRLMNLVPD